MQKNSIALIFPELSYKIVGRAFDVYNEIGSGYKEKVYQKALAKAFMGAGVIFKEQVYSPIIYEGENVGKHYLDFVIDDKIVVELKSGEKFVKQNINQIFSYLKAKNLKLGILINFTKEGVKFRRIVNIN